MFLTFKFMNAVKGASHNKYIYLGLFWLSSTAFSWMYTQHVKTYFIKTKGQL